MKIEDAKIGQIVIGNEGAKVYTHTRTGVKCKVLYKNSYEIRVVPIDLPYECSPSGYYVNPEHFDLYDEYQKLEINEKMMRDLLKCPEGKAIYVKDSYHSPYIIKNTGVYDNEGDCYSFGNFIYIIEDKEYKIDDIPCDEMTLEEVCKALGKNIKIIKGETK